MTDSKTWPWKKRSAEKTSVAPDKVDLSLRGNEGEVQTILTDKAELERDLKVLKEKLSSAISEGNSKDHVARKQAKMAQEAIAGWEKAEKEAIALKQELNKTIQHRVAGDERLVSLDAALKECMLQLRFVREEQEKRIHDAIMKTSREFEKTRTILEEKLAETTERLAKLSAENTQLSKALLAKNKVIKDVNGQRFQAEADFSAVMTRLESTEKENASLKYEVRVIEKELEIRNEEREFNHRTEDVAHKQHLESVKKIAKLETECQRLRLLVRKRLPGPGALAKMKSEVEILSRNSSESRRRKSNPSPIGSVDFSVDSAPDTPGRRTNFLTEQLYAMEEENRTLKELLNEKTNELQLSRTMYARTASKVIEGEAKVEEPSKGSARNLPTPQELSLASLSDIGSDEKVSWAESWASAMISDMEHLRNGKHTGTPSCKGTGASDIDLMDDFVEMEKLAVYEGKPFGNSHISSEEGNAGPLEILAGRHSVEATGREMVPLSDCQSGISVSNQEIQPNNELIDKIPGWLSDIQKLVLEQTRSTHRNPDNIVEDIRVALGRINHPNPGKSGSSNSLIANNISSAKNCNHSDISDSIHKMIELLQGITLPCQDYGTPEILSRKDGNSLPYKISETSTDYMVRVFQWKTSELGAVLHQFVQTCHSLLNGKADMQKFAEDITSALDWIMNHCFSLQDVSSMKDAIKKHFDWDETRSESEVESGLVSHFAETDKLHHLHAPKEQLSHFPIVSSWNVHNNVFHFEDFRPGVSEEGRRLKDELEIIETAKKSLERRLQSEMDKNESLMVKLQESEERIESFKTDADTMQQSKGVSQEQTPGVVQDQIYKYKMANDELHTQLVTAQVELNEARENVSSLATELKNKSSHEELEAVCLDLQLQLESVKKEIPKHDDTQEEKQLRTDWEITTASEKLAECQETILNLGKQLQALASPRDAALFDKVTCTPTNSLSTTTISEKNINQRSSLLDKMLAEDNAEKLWSPKTKELSCPSESATLTDGQNSYYAFGLSGTINSPHKFINLNGIKHQDEEVVSSKAIVPSKKRGGVGFFKKLLWRQKKGKSKKTSFPHADK
ncbi:hypothetical protein RJ640_030473 [Escallonia rubra]|uniref:Filament-like plant protein 7 n=1 Tax=Escallonia rubra TaxID=112253 RepID=A0AA88QFX0_9ASTE|nr:hypothetical protein RJ640_030473 [Escallonia rubra]